MTRSVSPQALSPLSPRHPKRHLHCHRKLLPLVTRAADRLRRKGGHLTCSEGLKREAVRSEVTCNQVPQPPRLLPMSRSVQPRSFRTAAFLRPSRPDRSASSSHPLGHHADELVATHCSDEREPPCPCFLPSPRRVSFPGAAARVFSVIDDRLRDPVFDRAAGIDVLALCKHGVPPCGEARKWNEGSADAIEDAHRRAIRTRSAVGDAGDSCIVSRMRAATTSPDANVTPATSQIAASMPSASAVIPASNAPIA